MNFSLSLEGVVRRRRPASIETRASRSPRSDGRGLGMGRRQERRIVEAGRDLCLRYLSDRRQEPQETAGSIQPSVCRAGLVGYQLDGDQETSACDFASYRQSAARHGQHHSVRSFPVPQDERYVGVENCRQPSAGINSALSVISKLVDLERFELSTSSMPWKRAPNCATGPRARSLRPENITAEVPGRRDLRMHPSTFSFNVRGY